MARYRLHAHFLDTLTHKQYEPGVYDEAEINVAGAMSQNIITLERAAPQTEVTTVRSHFAKEQFFGNYSIPNLLLGEEDKIVTTKPIKINKLTAEELGTLKDIGKTMVSRILANRPFSDYEDMDNRCPFGKHRKWQNHFILSFDGFIANRKQEFNVY